MCLIKTDEVSRMQYEVLVVHHDKKIRSRICEAIRTDSELAVWGEVDSVTDACKLLEYGLPALVLIDLGLPDGDGETIISVLCAHAPYVKTLVLSMPDDQRNLNTVIESGASGYLHNYHESENISPGIKQALKGRPLIFPAIKPPPHNVNRKIGTNIPSLEPTIRTKNAENASLTPAEIDILNYVAKGFTGPEIADITGRSVNTVPVHMKSIYRKLSVSGRGEAVYRALQLGLIATD